MKVVVFPVTFRFVEPSAAHSATTPLAKFIPFTKVDSVRREVSGIVTAERPDKDFEVCDYTESKPFYQAWSEEFAKVSDGKNYGNLRAMHGLTAAGKAIRPIYFNDEEKQIEMTFKVIDEAEWKKVDERVYTGFSQGGRKVGEMRRDPVYKNCMRYVANPSEVSLVDNPCLPDAKFAYVKTDGSVEMRKFLKIEEPVDHASRITALEQEVTLLKAASTTGSTKTVEHDDPVSSGSTEPARVTTGDEVNDPIEKEKESRTKRVAGKDLPASEFAYVGDPDNTDTWKIRIDDQGHVRNALSRWGQEKSIPDSAKAKVRAKILAAARRFGVDVASEGEKLAAFRATMRQAARVYVNQNFSRIASKSVLNIDNNLGKLAKGMGEVSRLAYHVEELGCLLRAATCEQEYELDEELQLPEMLRADIADLVKTVLQMVDEECREVREQETA